MLLTSSIIKDYRPIVTFFFLPGVDVTGFAVCVGCMDSGEVAKTKKIAGSLAKIYDTNRIMFCFLLVHTAHKRASCL